MLSLACLSIVESPHHNLVHIYGLPGEGSLPVPLVLIFPNPLFSNGNDVGIVATPVSCSIAHYFVLYKFKGWVAPYFVVNYNGNKVVQPHGYQLNVMNEVINLNVMKIIKKVVGSKYLGGLGMPTLLIIRFLDVLKHMLEHLQSTFDSTIYMQSI